MNNVVRKDDDEPERNHVPAAITPMQMLATAVEQGADMDKLEKLMLLQERWESNEARKAWNQAMAALKADPPRVRKNKHVSFNKTSYDHATLDNMANAVSEKMTPLGLSFRWETDQSNGMITVTCVVAHKDGHSERTTLSAAADQSGGKNSIQAVGSAVSYLSRYTLKSAIGIAEEGQGDDARSYGQQTPAPVSEDQAVQIEDRLKETDTDLATFLEVFARKANTGRLNDVREIPACVFDFAIQVINHNYERKQKNAQ